MCNAFVPDVSCAGSEFRTVLLCEIVIVRPVCGVLGGTFPEIQGTGYGMTLMAGPRERRLSYRTEVSSNNPHVLRVHQNFGRVVYKEQYVLRKFMPGPVREDEQGERREGSNV